MYSKLCDFKQLHGHYRVQFNDESNEPWSKWVSLQRFVGTGDMNETRRQRLDALNVTWRVQGGSSHAATAAADDDDANAAGTV
jgi:hypothetical protein